jgi:hypothetical protein
MTCDKVYRFRTVCPSCRNVSEIASEEISPVVCCGNCLMEDIKVQHLKIYRIEDAETQRRGA